MLSKADRSAGFAVAAALMLFFVGGLITTVVPPLVDKSWGRPFENHDPSKGPTGKLMPYTALQLKGRAIYVREGCWYCHTQQTRTLVADTKRSGWKGVDSPVSTPDEFVYDSARVRTFRAWAGNTTRSGIGRICAIRGTWCRGR
jgi:cbb3-type cytochrome oxidase cytochrome c subunit